MRSRRLASASETLRALLLRRRAGVAIAAIAMAALAIGIVVAAGLPGSSPAASSPGKVAGATTVQRRDLVATDTESGTLTYASAQTVFNRLSGTITWLPTVGQLVKPGHTLYQVDGQPVVLFNGTTPAYRDLTSGVSDGSDVLELNRDLVSMGFDPDHEITVNNSWQTGTTDAIDRWQAAIGASQTGAISLGQVVFLPGAQRVTSVNTVLGSTGGSGAASGSGSGASAGSGSSSGSGSGSSSGSGSTSGASTSVSPQTEFVSLTTNQVGSSAAPMGGTGGARPDAAAIMASWNAACATDDVATLESLKRQHPHVLASVEPSDCAPKPKPAPDPSPTPTETQPAPPTTTVEASQMAPTFTTTTPTSTNPSGSGSPSGNGNPSGKRPSHGSGGMTPSLQSALAALLKAEALELQRNSASAGRGGGSSSSLGGASSGGRLSSSPASNGSGGAGSSGGGGSSAGGGAGSSGSSAGANAQAILGTTSTQLNVMVNLDATKQSEAVEGEPVTVQMPDGSVVDGKITQVSPVAQSSSSNGSSNGSGSGSGTAGGGSSSSAPTSTVPVTIALHGRLPASGLDHAAVSVNFEQQVERGVLSVPVTALLATAGGGYAVQVAGQSHRLIAVTPGLFAAGYVQVSSSQIYPGLQVTDSQG